jgi:hypothetical protein
VTIYLQEKMHFEWRVNRVDKSYSSFRSMGHSLRFCRHVVYQMLIGRINVRTSPEIDRKKEVRHSSHHGGEYVSEDDAQ